MCYDMDRTVEVVGVPMDLGADRRGVDMGPSAIRYGGLAAGLEAVGQECVDGGDLAVPRPEESQSGESHGFGGKAKYLEQTRIVCERLEERVREIRSEGTLPLVLGGDHSIGIGTANGVAETDTGVLWFDAHGDLNTPATTPSGNVHGMTLAAILGEGAFADQSWAAVPEIEAENIALVGVRSLDSGEKTLIEDSGINVYTMMDIDERGITTVVREALAAVTGGTDQLSVSLDLDVLDPGEAPGVGTPVRGGISYREAHAAMEIVSTEAETALAALELVEVNPIFDEHNQTAELACELAASALGETIL